MPALQTVLGGEDALADFLVALAAIAGFSGLFVWLNRDVWVEALAGAVAWSLSAYVFMGVFSSSGYWGVYWVFPVVAVGSIVGLGSLITIVRRQRRRRCYERLDGPPP